MIFDRYILNGNDKYQEFSDEYFLCVITNNGYQYHKKLNKKILWEKLE